MGAASGCCEAAASGDAEAEGVRSLSDMTKNVQKEEKIERLTAQRAITV